MAAACAEMEPAAAPPPSPPPAAAAVVSGSAELVCAQGRNLKAVLCQRCGSRVLLPGAATFARREVPGRGGEGREPREAAGRRGGEVPPAGGAGRGAGAPCGWGCDAVSPAAPPARHEEEGGGGGGRRRGPAAGALAGARHVLLRERGLHPRRGQRQVPGVRRLRGGAHRLALPRRQGQLLRGAGARGPRVTPALPPGTGAVALGTCLGSRAQPPGTLPALPPGCPAA